MLVLVTTIFWFSTLCCALKSDEIAIFGLAHLVVICFTFDNEAPLKSIFCDAVQNTIHQFI